MGIGQARRQARRQADAKALTKALAALTTTEGPLN